MIGKRLVAVLSAGTVLLLVIGECTARFVLGLGDPPLSEGAVDSDYLFKPNQRCRRFGNRVYYNNYSMRSDFDVQEGDPRPRVFVVGDSVVNGGALTDQDETATAILQQNMPDWRVYNVSAGSWGPGNYVAFFRRYPTLVRTNDVLVLQVSSHDLWEDDPKERGGRDVGVDISFPNEKPWCALWEGWVRYGRPRLYAKLGVQIGGRGEEGVKDAVGKVSAPHEEAEAQNRIAAYNLACCEELFALPFARRILLVHRTQAELNDDRVPVGESVFVEFAKKRGGVVVSDGAKSDLHYRDAIHLNAAGQRRMAESILQALDRAEVEK